MKKQFGKLLQRLRKSNPSRVQRKKKPLQMEALERRQLLAADFGAATESLPFHNSFIAEDVDGNFAITARDALLVVNKLNENQGLTDHVEGQERHYLDTDGNNVLTAKDALFIFNALNGEAETNPTAVFTYAFVDDEGAPITNNQVAVGDRFQLQTFVRDTRGFSAGGINAAYVDIGFDNGDSFDVAVGEIQSFRFFFDKLDGNATDSSFTLSFQGQTTNPIPLFSGTSPRNDVAIASSIQAELEALSNVGTGNVRAIVDTIAKQRDEQDNVPRFSFQIRFLDDLAGQDLPLVSVDASNIGVQPGETFDFSVEEVLAGNESTPEAEARAIVFSDTYANGPRAEVQTNLFNDVGAFSDEIPLPDPGGTKLVFSIPMIATSPGTINFTPAFPDNSPETDIVAGVTTIPETMVDFGSPFALTVISDPTAPVANNDTLSINEDTSVTLNGNVTSNDTVTSPRTLSVVSVSATAGTVGSISGLTYTPPADFFGTDIITYVAEDSTGLQTNTGTVTINVANVNDPPIAANDSFTVDEDSTDNVLDVLANDTGGPANESGDTLSVTAVGTASNGTVTFTANNVSYTPNAAFVGQDTFTYTVSDQDGATDTATVTVDVEPATLPRARTDSVSTPENAPIDIDVLANDGVNPGETAVLLGLSTEILPTFGSVQVTANNTILYTPADADFNGVDRFTYIMNDTAGTGEDSVGTVTVTVTDINDAPVLANDTANATEDTETTFAASTLLSNDSPGPGEDASSQNPQTLTITDVSGLTAGGSVSLSNGDVVYTPAADFNGSFSFSYTATDNGSPALSETATVTVTVAAVNDPPVAVADTASGTEDQVANITTASLLANDSTGAANEVQTLTVTGVSSTSSNGGTVGLSGTDITYTPAADFNGADTFTYSLSDGVTTTTGTVTISVAPVNDAPIAVDDTASGFNQQGIVLQVSDLLSNDSAGPANESNQTLSISAVTANANTNGTVVLNGNGTITYTPATDFAGDASFQYTLQDSAGGEATGTVNVTVEAFTPSTLGGQVWVDETGDGIIDADERDLGAVIVTLTGTALGEAISPQSKMTLSDGSYSFDNLAPGTYTITLTKPHFFLDGLDVPGTLGDLDAIENQFTISIAEPGGVVDTGYNFAMLGLDTTFGRPLDQLASRYIVMNPSLAYNGAYFGLGADNSLLWSARLDGFSNASFAEAVMDDSGDLLLSYVDGSGNIFTSSLGRGEFIHVTDAGGNMLIRVLGGSSNFDWQQVSMAAPPFSAEKYLDSIDAIFDQQGW